MDQGFDHFTPCTYVDACSIYFENSTPQNYSTIVHHFRYKQPPYAVLEIGLSCPLLQIVSTEDYTTELRTVREAVTFSGNPSFLLLAPNHCWHQQSWSQLLHVVCCTGLPHVSDQISSQQLPGVHKRLLRWRSTQWKYSRLNIVTIAVVNASLRSSTVFKHCSLSR